MTGESQFQTVDDISASAASILNASAAPMFQNEPFNAKAMLTNEQLRCFADRSSVQPEEHAGSNDQNEE